MSAVRGWQPPRETCARRHSVFLDVELWDERGGDRTWSCAFLAAVWQVLRLGLLRADGGPVLTPQPLAGPLPGSWDQLPPLLQLRPEADPFAAYRTASVLSSWYLPVEHAVRVLLDQLAPDEAALGQVAERAAAEGLRLPDQVVDRVSYVFHGP
jgi:hypothetical protein